MNAFISTESSCSNVSLWEAKSLADAAWTASEPDAVERVLNAAKESDTEAKRLASPFVFVQRLTGPGTSRSSTSPLPSSTTSSSCNRSRQDEDHPSGEENVRRQLSTTAGRGEALVNQFLRDRVDLSPAQQSELLVQSVRDNIIFMECLHQMAAILAKTAIVQQEY